MNREEEIIKEAFNALLIPQTKIAIMKGYGSSYTPENIDAAYNKFKIMIEGKLKAKGYIKQEEKEKSYVPTLKPKSMVPSLNVQNRGFADIIVLTIIVLVYAAIIINLLLKLK